MQGQDRAEGFFFTKTFLQVLENRAADAEGKVKVVDINKVEI